MQVHRPGGSEGGVLRHTRSVRCSLGGDEQAFALWPAYPTGGGLLQPGPPPPGVGVGVGVPCPYILQALKWPENCFLCISPFVVLVVGWVGAS